MSFYIESSSQDTFVPVPVGSHLGRCYRIIDLGTQRTEYMGEVKFLRKVMFGWELHGEDGVGNPLLTAKGEPMAIFKNYTLSLSEKANLRHDLQSWRGKDFTDDELRRFDISVVLGQWGMVNVVHRPGKDGKIFSNVQTVTAVPSMVKKMGFPEGHNPLQVFKLASPDVAMFETFSKGLKAKIEASPEWKAFNDRKAAPTTSPDANPVGDMEDDLPF